MWEKLHNEYEQFMDNIFLFISELGIDVKDLQIDHAALRFKNSDDVNKLIAELEPIGKKLSEAIVNGRTIYIYKLNSPLIYRNFSVPCVELPYPAANHDFDTDGWEHLEFVLSDTEPDTLDGTFREIFPSLTDEILKKYDFKISTPKASGEQLLNTTISLQKYKGLAVKFHCYSIEDVVRG